MSLFVDTSAFLAVLDAGDEQHEAADRCWREALGGTDTLFTSNYVLVETFALVQRRMGLDAVRRFHADVGPALSVIWVQPADHDAALATVIALDRRRLSLVDASSFQLMRRTGLRCAFAFDPHFTEQGFDCVP